MKGKVGEARQRREERQNAVLGKEFEDSENGMVTEDQDSVRMMLSGFEVDVDEALHESIAAVETALAAMAEGAPPIYVLKGLWMDGLMIGLFVKGGN